MVCDLDFEPETLTFAAQIRVVRSTICHLLKAFGAEALGCTQPWGDVVFEVDPFKVVHAGEILSVFAARRPVRTSADLARRLCL